MASEKYYENTRKLKEMIRNGSIQIEEIKDERKYMCYFCLQEIKNKKGMLLINPTKNGYETYPIDETCLEKIRQFDEYNGLERGLN